MIDLRLAFTTGVLGALGLLAPTLASTATAHTATAHTATAHTDLAAATASRPRPAPAPASSPPAPAPATAAPPAPVHPAVTHRPSIRIDGASAGDLAQVRSVPGVRDATAIRVGRLSIGAGQDALTVAAVNVAAFRRFVPQVTADADDLWARLADGDMAVTFGGADDLGLGLGEHVAVGGRYAVDVRVGAFASNGTPPVADAVVGQATGHDLGLDTVAPTILVSVDDGTNPGNVADRLREITDHVSVIPDPHQPRPVTDAQRRGAATVWDVLALCESSGDWHADTGNGFYGGLQFLPESWHMVGGRGMPDDASRQEQIFRAQRLQALQGWKAWPVCSVKLGLRPPPPGWPANIS